MKSKAEVRTGVPSWTTVKQTATTGQNISRDNDAVGLFSLVAGVKTSRLRNSLEQTDCIIAAQARGLGYRVRLIVPEALLSALF